MPGCVGEKKLQEAQTHTPKRVSCLWLLVIIPGMSGLHLLVTHCFQDNHNGGKLERIPRHLQEVVVMTPSLFKKRNEREREREKHMVGRTHTLAWSLTASPSLTTCCCRKNIDCYVPLEIKLRKCLKPRQLWQEISDSACWVQACAAGTWSQLCKLFNPVNELCTFVLWSVVKNYFVCFRQCIFLFHTFIVYFGYEWHKPSEYCAVHIMSLMWMRSRRQAVVCPCLSSHSTCIY